MLTLHAFLIFWHWFQTQTCLVIVPGGRVFYGGGCVQALETARTFAPHVTLQVGNALTFAGDAIP